MLVGALELVTADDPVLLNTPLIIIDKFHHHGQSRILADMKMAGQNMCMGAHPTVFSITELIL
jgi:hypothetical protein